MATKFKLEDEIASIATELKKRRLALGLTMKDVEKSQHINCGQISRLEAGQFRTNSPNLQKLCNFLQIEIDQSTHESDLGARIEHFAARSSQHRAAAEEILRALERIG